MTPKDKFQEAKEQALADHCQRSHHKNYNVEPVLGRNVMGVGIGYRIKDGRKQQEKCVRFYLNRKIKPPEAVPEGERIEKSFGSVNTDVIAVRQFASFDPGPRPGSSFGLNYSAPNVEPFLVGTVGSFVKFDGIYYVLASNHVMAVNGRVPPEQEIIFRPQREFIDNPATYVFARTKVHVPLSQKRVNYVDCALAQVVDQGRVESVFAQFPQHILIDSDKVIPPTLDMEVVRVDETEGPRGTIVDVNARMKIDFSFGTFEFDDLILIERTGNTCDGKSFANPGDSGSLLIDQKTRQATALIVGGNGIYTVACPLRKSLQELAKALRGPKAVNVNELYERVENPAGEVELVVPRPRHESVKSSSRDYMPEPTPTAQ